MAELSISTSRGENSLYFLTIKFFDLLKSHNAKPMLINSVAKTLDIPKRRAYYVINALEGLGLVERSGVGLIKWTGGDFFNLYYTIRDKAMSTAEEESVEYRKKVEQEKILDEQLMAVDKRLETLLCAEETGKMTYITNEDVLAVGAGSKNDFYLINTPYNINTSQRWLGQVHKVEFSTDGEVECYHINSFGCFKVDKRFPENN